MSGVSATSNLAKSRARSQWFKGTGNQGLKKPGLSQVVSEGRMLMFLLVLAAEVWSGYLFIALGKRSEPEAEKSTIFYPATPPEINNWMQWVPHIPKFVVTRREKFERACTAMDWFDWASIGLLLVCQEVVRVLSAETVGEW